jgi:putative membrane protein insertion efficiency factor
MKKAEGRMKKQISAPARCLSAFFFLPSSFLVTLVRLYRLTLSPAKAFLFGPSAQCRFQPSCSQYAIEALKTHGAIAGGCLAAKRVCRCHPWGECGEDPVPPVGRDGALRRPRAVQARNSRSKIFSKIVRSARWTRAGTAQRAVPTIANSEFRI